MLTVCWLLLVEWLLATILVKSYGTHGLFWQFHHSFPPPPYNVGSVHSKCPPWSNIIWGEGGGDHVLEVTRFIHQTRGDDVNIANLQGVPHIAFDQDFIRILSGTFSWLIVSLLACMVCCLVWFVCQLVGCVHWMVRWLHAWQFAVLAVWLLASQLVRLVDCLYTNTCLCGWLFDWFMYYIRLLIQFHCSAWLDKSCAPL